MSDEAPKSTWQVVIADLETNGLLRDVSKIHCLGIIDIVTGEEMSCADKPGYVPLDEGFGILAKAKRVIGHNFLTYDARVIRKLRPKRDWLKTKQIVDTLILARLLWPEIKNTDFARFRKGTMPGRLLGRHSLEAWGYRLGLKKGEYGKQENAWEVWTPDMSDYMMQDCRVNRALWWPIKTKMAEGWLPADAARLEHDVADICQTMHETGWPFDVAAAGRLYAEVSSIHQQVSEELQVAFPPMEVTTTFIPKVNNAKLGYKKGCPFLKRKMEKFNPASMDHIAKRFHERYGWNAPTNPETGRVTIGDEVLETLDYPEVALLRRYLKVNKVLATLSNGKQAWLKMVWQDNRMHAEYNTCGAVTTRSSHRNPNIAQVPSVSLGKDDNPLMGEEGGWGYECRQLFGVPAGWYQVGVDMSGIELRCLANRLAPYDKLLYATTILSGDIHALNQKAAGWKSRKDAKTGVYQWLYGAGAELMGTLMCPLGTTDERVAAGRQTAKGLLTNIRGLGDMRDAVKTEAENGWITGLDGRRITIRKPFAALNSALQSDGAIVAKRWMVIFVAKMEAAGYEWGRDWFMLGWVHDEIQSACRTREAAEALSSLCIEAIQEAGEYYNMAIRLDGEAKIGRNWAECH